MAKQAKQKKTKVNPAKVNRREMIHMDYLNVYNEVLKFEEVVDLDIDFILGVTKEVLSEELSLSKLSSTPSPHELEALAEKILDRIRDVQEPTDKLITDDPDLVHWDY